MIENSYVDLGCRAALLLGCQKVQKAAQAIVQACVISLQYRQFLECGCLAHCCSAAGPKQVIRTMSNNT